ncbi:thiamine-phosphate kinase [Halococcoides cellulosivorans]|uniref:Thiamine-monophosphate kinase n=1 Tax=Halococcoides cellulosivorans TaxID=1679096 RepID=A0A2R4X4G0_9EURY|nr:thiamine-phosphate kinase [Halococcoides cellulosivorans]AWB28680.1 thiamine-phosphate kinase [Halococcoides cellulosivorans]
MDERAALAMITDQIDEAGDDAAIVDGTAITIDMLHDSADFPAGVTDRTMGWRSVAVSLSDLAAVGADPVGAVAAYGAPTFSEGALTAFVTGAREVCDAVGTEYVGGDLDCHDERTIATAAVGRVDHRVGRAGATPGDAVCVTGCLGTGAAAFKLFETGKIERANQLYRFSPRIAAGRALAPVATAMMDSSDGLARSLHQIAAASDCGITIEGDLPIDPALREFADTDRLATTFGEDFELIVTLPEDAIDDARARVPVDLTRIGTVTESGVTRDGDPLPDEGYVHDPD